MKKKKKIHPLQEDEKGEGEREKERGKEEDEGVRKEDECERRMERKRE